MRCPFTHPFPLSSPLLQPVWTAFGHRFPWWRWQRRRRTQKVYPQQRVRYNYCVLQKQGTKQTTRHIRQAHSFLEVRLAPCCSIYDFLLACSLAQQSQIVCLLGISLHSSHFFAATTESKDPALEDSCTVPFIC